MKKEILIVPIVFLLILGFIIYAGELDKENRFLREENLMLREAIEELEAEMEEFEIRIDELRSIVDSLTVELDRNFTWNDHIEEEK